jgi:hypothetical protein
MAATKAKEVVFGPSDAERALASWREHDAAHALHAPDRAAIRGGDALRALVLELLVRPNRGRDLFNACARLGRLLADAGASPSLAGATIDGAAAALSELGVTCDPGRVSPARASVVEGYVATVVENERAAARRAWDYPSCAVRVTKEAVAIVAGYPVDDGEALADWSARVALGVSKDGYKRAIVSAVAGPGGERAQAELTQALSLVGVDLAEAPEPKGWLSSLLKR